MDYQRIKDKLIIRLDRGDFIMEHLAQIAKKENIKTASISGIGAVDFAQLNFYRLSEQNYQTVDFKEEFEVLSMNGNYTLNDGEPHIHLHIVLGRDDYSTIGGHLKDGRVSITLEVFVDIIELDVIRTSDQTLDNFKYMDFR